MIKTALVTGATSGIGYAVAQMLQDKGYRVIGTSRDASSIPDSAKIGGVEYRSLDLADPASLEGFVSDLGPVDVLINNAGESQAGPLEELPLTAIERLFAVNVFGPIRLAQAVLPGMRERGFGRVVMVGSMLASFPLAYRSSYVASKAAIKGFADAARLETAPFGVHVSTVEPGSINTGISSRRTKYGEDSAYSDDFATVLAALERNEKAGIDATTVAHTIIDAVQSPRPKALYAAGSGAGRVFFLKRFLPARVIEQGIARKHGLTATNRQTIRYNALAALWHGSRHSDPPGANRWDDIDASGPVVVLVHGLGGNSATSWFTLSPLLASRGSRVFTFDYGRHGQGLLARPRGRGAGLPGVGDAKVCAEELERFVERVLAATGAEKVALVGHSFGALVAQYYLLRRGGSARVSHFVGLAPTVHGTTFNGLLRVPKADRIGAGLVGANIIQQAAGSKFLESLYADGELAEGVEYTIVSPKWDAFSTPVKSQSIDGAKNIRLGGLAGHLFVLFNRKGLDHVATAVEGR